MKIEKAIKTLTEAGYEVVIREMYKGGEKVQGLTVKVEGIVAPVVYPELMSDRADIVQIIKDALNAEHETDKYLLRVRSWEYVKDHIYIGVRPLTGDDSIEKKQFLDIEQYLYISVDEEAKATVTKEIAETFSGKDVWKQARKNTQDAAVVMNMAEMLGMDDDFPLTVITNERTYDGAGVIAVPEVFKEIAEAEGKDLYILPSSVHELLVCTDDSMGIEDLRGMVKEVNNTQVAPHERLSYNVYKYLKDLNKVVIE